MTTSTSASAQAAARLATLPAPMNVPASGFGALLQHPQHDGGAGGVGKAGQLLERLLGIDAPDGAGDQADQRGALTLPGGCPPSCVRVCGGTRPTVA